MHLTIFLWEYPFTFSFSFLKVGISPLKINTFQCFKYRHNRAVSVVLTVFETLENVDFH